jgi:hypothetical protein
MTHHSPNDASYLHTITQAVHHSPGLKEGFTSKVPLLVRHHSHIWLHRFPTIQTPDGVSSIVAHTRISAHTFQLPHGHERTYHTLVVETGYAPVHNLLEVA